MNRIIFFFFLPTCLFALAPLVPERVSLVTTSFSRFETEHFFDKHGEVKKAYNDFTRDQIEVLIDYGLSSRNNITAWGAFDLVQDHLNGNSYEIADAELSFKQALKTTERSILAAELLAIIPTNKNYDPEIRYGRWGAEGALLYAKTFFPYGKKTTLDGRLGYRWYSGFPSDQIRSAITLWVDLSCRWQILAQTSVEYGLFNGEEPLNKSFFFYNANYRVWKGRLEAIYYVSNQMALYAGYSQHFLGQNIATSGEWYARVAFCF